MNFKYLVQRSVMTVLLILLVLSLLFFFFRLMPGDPLSQYATAGMTDDELQAIREMWGLDQPLWRQYLDYMINMVTLDAGVSHVYNRPVNELVWNRLVNSLVLLVPAIVTSFAIGTGFGAVIGTRVGTRLERWGIVIPTIAGTIPSFFMGILLLTIFAGGVLSIFPTGGMVSTEMWSADVYSIYLTTDFLMHATLPFLSLVIVGIYTPALLMRTSIVEVSGQDFMFYHRVKGMPERTRLVRLMRHASLPVVTVFPIALTTAVSGSVLIELVFNWPGMGLLLVEATIARDFPVIQFIFGILAVLIILANFIVDILYTVLDPRVEIGEGG